ncbi:DUF4177 domain-containing protein [Alkaliphilus peptidifermentans]|uniref:DUF4177 domain-containing protein n=1 Tax=Alkaliphilus peptidifermentans DSM 18978 TaxID=1120976 RepID=A0A1G5J1F2_9FIRM|nr:DUF4177 domain-containing protein [Alkaliphilus peptidifermentans]SCY81649.1 protein of unknown function [Alkaliphilus peptidifermentans DSM 18978]
MYEYMFIKIDLNTNWKGRSPVEDYHKVIEQHASEGWRLVQVFAPPISGYGVAEFHELIFEKKK